MGRMTGKVAIVTGAAGGIGLATAELLAEEGAHVVLTDIKPAGEAEAARMAARGLDAVFMKHDVTCMDDWERVFTGTLGRFGKLNVLVNNAGIARIENVENMTLEAWRQTLAVNLDAVFMGTQKAIVAMKGIPDASGSIINLSSIEGIVGEPLLPSYNAGKGGVRLFTKSMALHCAKNGYNIRVNSVHPGFIATDMVRGILATLPPEMAQALHDELFNHRIPIRRPGTPKEIAYGILFLASDESSLMTGAELVLDGGYTAQ